MLIKHLCHKARSEIKSFEVLNNDTLAFSTKIHGAKLFSHLNCSALKNLSIELLGSKTTAVAFNPSGTLLAFANTNLIYIINTQTKHLLQTIRTFEGAIEVLSFVPDTKYLIAGGKHGRVMQYRYDGRSHLSRLCSFGQAISHSKSRINNNYVSAIAFHKNILAVSGYGGVITILKINSYTNRYNIQASNVRINALCFLNDKRLVSGSVSGIVSIHSLHKYQNIKNINTPFTNINSIIQMKNKRYIMVSAESKNLILIDIIDAKIVSTNYLSFHDNVSNIRLSNSGVLLAIINNRELFKIELPSVEHIKSFLLHNSLDKAYNLIEKDPMLRGTREHTRVEVMYTKLYEKAIEALINLDTKEARRLMQMFSEVKSKKDEINSIFKAFEHYPRFKNLCLENKFSLAYIMAEKHPSLKYTKQFKKMEDTFKESFTFAQKQILIGREDIAKEVLSIYATVASKKPMLKLVLKQNKEFIRFLKAINEKDYSIIDTLVENNPEFKDIPNYILLQKEIRADIEKIRKLINNAEDEEALSSIKKYINAPSIQNELQILYNDTKLLKKLKKSYEDEDFVSCYEILDSSDALDSVELVVLLEKHWSKLMSSCEEFALKGDIKNIKLTLKELIKVKTRVDKIGDLLRLSFHIKIKGLMAKQSFKSAENIIYSYIDIFGDDSELQLIMRTFKQNSQRSLAITLKQTKRLSRDNWLNSKLIMD